MLTMYDSTDYLDIPSDAEAVMGYVNGPESAWPDAGWTAFPNAKVIWRCTTSADADGDVLDVESGDADAIDIPAWYERFGNGKVKIAYCSLDSYDACWEYAADIHQILFFVADWTNEPHMVNRPRVIATQYAHPPLSGGHYDKSLLSFTVPPEPSKPMEFDVTTVPTIQRNSTGEVVRTCQALLREKGRQPIAIDGIYGPLTEQAVKNYQAFFKLSVDGICGPITWGALILL